MARVSPLLIAYERLMTGGILTGEPERPEFPDTVPERVAAAAGDLWEAAHDVDRERDLLHRIIVDGEVIILDGGMTVPADGFEPVASGPEWNREVVGFKIGRSTAPRRAGVFYLGDRRPGALRAVPWVGPALPFASALGHDPGFRRSRSRRPVEAGGRGREHVTRSGSPPLPARAQAS